MRVVAGLAGAATLAVLTGAMVAGAWVPAGPALAAGAALTAEAAASTLYVSPVLSCSDTGPGTQQVPFCTVQAAANVVNPGQTVDIEDTAGTLHGGPVTITRSGTSSEPITFTGTWGSPALSFGQASGSTAAITLKDVRYVTLSNFGAGAGAGAGDAIDVIGSQHVTLDRLSLRTGSAAVTIDGSSSYVTLSRSTISGGDADGVEVEPGAAHVMITTNQVTLPQDATGNAVSLSGVSDSAVTGNTLESGCDSAVAVTGGSSATIENNLLMSLGQGCTDSVQAPLSVDASSAAQVSADYNAVFGTRRPLPNTRGPGRPIPTPPTSRRPRGRARTTSTTSSPTAICPGSARPSCRKDRGSSTRPTAPRPVN